MNKNIFDLEKELFLHTYKRIPLELTHGKDVYLYDSNGNKYLDFFSGLAVNALGYAHPDIIKAVSQQISKFGHLSNSYITDIQIEFTQKLLKYSGMQKAFLTNSGTEAVEASLKLIRKVKGAGKNIIAFTGSFHGRTYGALSITERKKYREGFEPFLPGIKHLPFNDINALKSNINNNVAAVFIELIQGEGGVIEASTEFIQELLSLKEKYDFIIVADEIQSGTGRTGFPFAFNIYKFVPDIVVTAKAIGGGLPLGAMLTSELFHDTFSPGDHGTTFGGNPVSCAAGLIVLEHVFEKGLLLQVNLLGKYLIAGMNILKEEFPSDIKEIRGQGFMLGAELAYNAEKIADNLRELKILVNVTNENVVRLLPPLTIREEHIDIFIAQLRKVLGNVNKN